MPHAIRRQELAALLGVVSRRRLVAAGLVLLGLSATEGISLLLLLPLLQLVGVDGGQQAAQGVTQMVGRLFAGAGVVPTLGAVLIVYVALAALQGALQRWQALVSAGLEQDIVATLRARVYRAVSRVQWAFFVRARASDFTHVLTTEIDRAGGAAYFAVDLAVSTAVVLVYFELAFLMSPVVATIVALFGLGLAFVTRHQLALARASGEPVSHATRALFAAIAEHLGGMKTAMSYGVEARHAKAFGRLSDDVRAARMKVESEYGRFRQFLGLGSTAGLALIVYVSLRVLAMPTAELIVLLFIFARLMPRLTSLYEKVQGLMAEMPAFAVVSALERRCEAAARPAVAQPHAMPFDHEIRFGRVTFDYTEDGHAPAVCSLDLLIPAGSTVGIVGPSGAGKSTIADLLLGLLTPSAGRLLIDGCPLDAAGLDAWRRQVGYVAQDTFLFHETVRANLLWARPEASEDDVWESLRLAAADAFVRALPQGLDTVLGDRGVLVSGGERQRLSLARALLRRPRLLVLDEATSSLDSENEAQIQRAIDGLHARMTIVIITHRLPAIRSADLIHVVDTGRVVESGTWDELIARGSGRFRQLCRAQGLADDGTRRGRPRIQVVGT